MGAIATFVNGKCESKELAEEPENLMNESDSSVASPGLRISDPNGFRFPCSSAT